MNLDTPDVVLIVVGSIAAFATMACVFLYNRLVTLRNQVRNAWAQIDVQLKRRWDLVPNLVEAVKGYAAHEKGVLEEVTRARGQAQQARGVPDRAKAEQALEGALGRLLAVVEQYPELKANQSFLALQEELVGTENRIGFARQLYNDVVLSYNTRTETFPSNAFAGMFEFKKESYFELQDEVQRQAPKVALA